MLLLFLACAMLPLGTLTVIVLTEASGEMERQAGELLRRTAKALGMAIVAEVTETRDASDHLAHSTSTSAGAALRETLREPAIERMRAIVALGEAGDTLIAVRSQALSSLVNPAQRNGGEGLFFVRENGGSHSVGLRTAHDIDGRTVQVLAFFDVQTFFGDPNVQNWRDSGVESCVMLDREAIWCSLPQATWGKVQPRDGAVAVGNQTYAAETWNGFATIVAPGTRLEVLVFAETPDALGGSATFRRSLLLLVLISVVLVFLASHVQLRRSLRPLEDLTRATQRVGARNLSVKVDVRTDDEFGMLARSFNEMSGRIASHVTLVSTTAAVNDEALRATSLTELLPGLTGHVRGMLPPGFGMSLAVRMDKTLWRRRSVMTGSADWVEDDIELGVAALGALQKGDMVVGRFGAPDSRPYLRAPSGRIGWNCQAVAIPLRAEQELAGVLSVLVPAGTLAMNSELENVRVIASDLALALNRTRLVHRLEQFNYGTLTALARTVDAKSPWTAGHSESVTYGAMQLGTQLNLTSDELDMLHRGGLLHDIGKIAVPGSILDKPARLTTEEMQLVQSHPEVGARILAPIEAYAPIIPIVMYHHERFDGEGYPSGLHGDAIPFLARVVAVVDVYDALVSDRPYRAGWEPDRALAHIQQSAGTHFDPGIAAALAAVEPQLRQWYADRREQDAARRGAARTEPLALA